MPAAETQALIQMLVNLGFAVSMALFLFVAYQKLVARLADLIKGNTQAMTRLSQVIAFLCQRFDNAVPPAGGTNPAPGRRWYDDPGGEE